MSPSCPSNRVLGSLLFGVGKPRKKRPLPLRHRETPTVNLQFTSVSLSNQAPLHLNKLSHKVRLLSFFNPLFKGGRSCPEFSISSKKKKKKKWIEKCLLKAFIHQACHKSLDRQCYDVSPVSAQGLARGQSHPRLINTPSALHSRGLGGSEKGKCTICAWVTAAEPATDRVMVIS